MDTQIESQLFISPIGELKLKYRQFSNLEFYIQGVRRDIFGNLTLHFTYFKSK